MPDFDLPGNFPCFSTFSRLGKSVPDLFCQQQKLQISELVNSPHIIDNSAKRYFCADSFLVVKFVRKSVPDFHLPGNFIHKQVKRAQVSLRDRDAYARKSVPDFDLPGDSCSICQTPKFKVASSLTRLA